MFQKLFQVTLVIFVVIFSVLALAIIGSLLMSLISGRIMAGSAGGAGIGSFSYAITQRQMALMVVAASLIIGGFYLYVRRNRFRR